MSGIPLCPECNQPDQVAKVSTLYLTAIGLNRLPDLEERSSRSEMEAQFSQGHGSNPAQTDFPQGLPIHNLSNRQLKELSQRLKPPASQKQAFSRPVHPDTVVLTFSLVVPFFIFGVIQSQAGMIVPLIVILVLAYGLYFWKRKTIIARFIQNLEKRTAAEMRVKQALDRWMNLYYCARDEVVFEPGVEQGTPVDLISGYLMKE